MKKLLLFFVTTTLSAALFAGGLVTNTNQSALYARLQSRNASTALDAVYFNPAGLTALNDGFFLSVSNQTIGQTRTITSTYPYLTGSAASREYTGKVSAPLFPGIYAVYKTGRLAFSAGVNPIGGGGGATYEKGLPSFEMMVADLVPLLNGASMPTTRYAADIFFEGSSVYFGYQANVSFKANDYISLAAGLRMVTAKNTYKGHILDISVNPNFPAFGPSFNGTNMVLARTFFLAGHSAFTSLAAGASSFAATLGGLIDGGTDPALLLTDVISNPDQLALAQQIIATAGQNPSDMNIGTARAVFTAAAPVFTGSANLMNDLADQTRDRVVDVQQKGNGFTPVIGINLTLSENLNVALKYEFKTKLELETTLTDNKGGGLFREGDTLIADMPAMLSAGFEYRPVDKLLLTGSMNLFFDDKVDYDGKAETNINMINKNFKELAFGLQYSLNDKLRASAGWLGTYTGVNSNYQTDQRYSSNTNSFGAGVGYRINDMIDLNLGGVYTMYKLATNDYNHFLGALPVPVKETYDKSTWIIALGLDFKF